jgi:hypothetical protein
MTGFRAEGMSPSRVWEVQDDFSSWLSQSANSFVSMGVKRIDRGHRARILLLGECELRDEECWTSVAKPFGIQLRLLIAWIN